MKKNNTVIKVEDLSFSYPGGDRNVLNNINFEVEEGDFIAIVGNNGCGKSTLCKALNGLIPHSIIGTFNGNIYINDKNTQDYNLGILAKNLGYVYQDFENQIVRPTVLDDASYSCLNYGMEDYEKRGYSALVQCGIEDLAMEYVWELSGGQTHLLALAGVLSLNPNILILDEPIAQLDPQNADNIYETLKILNEKYKKTIIVIEHSTNYIAKYCNKVILMKDGEFTWIKETKDALQEVDVLLESDIFPPQTTIAAKKAENLGLIKKDILPINIEEGKETFKNFVYSPNKENIKKIDNNQNKIISFENIDLSYKAVKGEDNKIFSNLNLHINSGEKIALIGSNGAGKSTLMKMLVGLVKPEKGQIIINGKNIKDMKVDELSRSISLVYQNPEQMFIMDSIEEDISYSSKVRNIPNWEEKTNTLLERFNLTDLKNRDGRLLSGGQMRRASLAIGVALDPKILLLDEPTANLDMRTRKEIINLLDEMKNITETVIIASHDMELVCDWADRIIVLYEGRIVGDGSRDDIFGNQEILDKVGIRPPEIFYLGKSLDEKALTYTINDFLESFEVKDD